MTCCPLEAMSGSAWAALQGIAAIDALLTMSGNQTSGEGAIVLTWGCGRLQAEILDDYLDWL